MNPLIINSFQTFNFRILSQHTRDSPNFHSLTLVLLFFMCYYLFVNPLDLFFAFEKTIHPIRPTVSNTFCTVWMEWKESHLGSRWTLPPLDGSRRRCSCVCNRRVTFHFNYFHLCQNCLTNRVLIYSSWIGSRRPGDVYDPWSHEQI